jgi:hypothetical protein
MPVCRSFWITELSGEYSFASTTARYHQIYNGTNEYSLHERDVSSRGEMTIGPMFNRSATRATGGTISVGFASAGPRLAIEARRRQWYPKRQMIDLSAGIVSMATPFNAGNAYGLTTGIYMGDDVLHVTAHGDLLLTGGRVRAGSTVGGGFGGYAALGATVLLVSLGVIAIIVIAHSGYD